MLNTPFSGVIEHLVGLEIMNALGSAVSGGSRGASPLATAHGLDVQVINRHGGSGTAIHDRRIVDLMSERPGWARGHGGGVHAAENSPAGAHGRDGRQHGGAARELQRATMTRPKVIHALLRHHPAPSHTPRLLRSPATSANAGRTRRPAGPTRVASGRSPRGNSQVRPSLAALECSTLRLVLPWRQTPGLLLNKGSQYPNSVWRGRVASFAPGRAVRREGLACRNSTARLDGCRSGWNSSSRGRSGLHRARAPAVGARRWGGRKKRKQTRGRRGCWGGYR